MRNDPLDRGNNVGQQHEAGIGKPAAAVEHLAHVVIQRLRQTDAMAGVRHLRAAAQGMDRAVHHLRQVVRRALSAAAAQVGADLLDVICGFLAVDLVQLRVHRRRTVVGRENIELRRQQDGGSPAVGRRSADRCGGRLDEVLERHHRIVRHRQLGRRQLGRRQLGRRLRVEDHDRIHQVRRVGDRHLDRRQDERRLVRGHLVRYGNRLVLVRRAAFGIAVGAGHDLADRCRDLAAALDLVNQLRQRIDSLAQQLRHARRAFQCLVEQAVQQVFDRPRKIPDETRADHAAAALQRMEVAPHRGQRVLIRRVLFPEREDAPDRGEHFARLLDEHADQQRIGGRVDRLQCRQHDGRGCCRLRRDRRDRRDGLRHRRIHGRQQTGQHLGRNHRWERRELHRGRGLRRRQVQRRQSRRTLLDEGPDADLGIVEHVPGIGATVLDRLHVVLEADDRIGDPLEALRIRLRRANLDEPAHLQANRIHQTDGARLAEHQQPGRNAPQQLRDVVETRCRRIAGVLHGGRNRILDACQVDDALAQHSLAHLPEFVVVRLAANFLADRRLRLGLGLGQDQAHEMLVEVVLDRQQHSGDLHQRGVAERHAAGQRQLQRRDLVLDALAQLAEAEHAEGVADLLQHVELRLQFLRLAAAAAHEDVQHVLDLREVLLDGHRDGVHQLDAGRRQAFAFLLDGIVDGQHLRELERLAHGGDAAGVGRGARDAVQEVVQQVDRRILSIALLAEVAEELELPVGLTEQALQRRRGLQAVVLQRLDDGAGDPPELEQRLSRRDLLQPRRHLAHQAEVVQGGLVTDQAEEPELELRTQASRHCRGVQRRLVADRRTAARRLVRLQVQQQQGPLGQQRRTAHRAQVVEQRQQDQRHVAAAREHAVEVGRQLHHRPHQRIEAVGVTLFLRDSLQQVARDLFHLLGQQRRAVDLDQPQHSLRDMQQFCALLEHLALVDPLRVRFQTHARLAQRRRHFLGDDMQGLRTEIRHAGCDSHMKP